MAADVSKSVTLGRNSILYVSQVRAPTVGYRKRTVIAFAVSEAVGEKTVAIIGVFHGGRDYESILAEPGE